MPACGPSLLLSGPPRLFRERAAAIVVTVLKTGKPSLFMDQQS